MKALDGRANNGKFWFFYGALSDVEYTIRVTDTVSGLVHSYNNAGGNICGVGDINAFCGGAVHHALRSDFGRGGAAAPLALASGYCGAGASTGRALNNFDSRSASPPGAHTSTALTGVVEATLWATVSPCLTTPTMPGSRRWVSPFTT